MSLLYGAAAGLAAHEYRRMKRKYFRPRMRAPGQRYPSYALSAAGKRAAAKIGASVAAGASLSYAKSRHRKYAGPRIIRPRRAMINRQIKSINKRLAGSTDTYIVKKRDVVQFSCPTNQAIHQHVNVNSVPDLEATLTEVPFFDVSTDSVVDKNLTNDQYSRSLLFKSIYSHIELFNNYRVPIQVRLYCVRPKTDTDINPSFAITDGIAKQMTSAQSLSSQLFPSDVTLFKDLWAIIKSKSVTIQPGRKLSMSHTVKDVSYDSATTDDQSDPYQRLIKNFTWLVRLEGVVGHDPSNPLNVGSLPCALDVRTDTIFTISYDGGLQGAQRYRFIDNSDSATTSVVSNKPAAVNQTYLVGPGL